MAELEMVKQMIADDAVCDGGDLDAIFKAQMAGKLDPESLDEAVAMGVSAGCAECAMAHSRRLGGVRELGDWRRLDEAYGPPGEYEYGEYDFGEDGDMSAQIDMMKEMIGPNAECNGDDMEAMFEAEMSGAAEPESVEDAMALGVSAGCAECAMAMDRRLGGLRRRLDGHADPVMEICFGMGMPGGSGEYDFGKDGEYDLGEYDFGKDGEYDLGEYKDFEGGDMSAQIDMMKEMIGPNAACNGDDMEVMFEIDPEAPEPESVEDAMALGLSAGCAECGMALGRRLGGAWRRLDGHDGGTDAFMEICFGMGMPGGSGEYDFEEPDWDPEPEHDDHGGKRDDHKDHHDDRHDSDGDMMAHCFGLHDEKMHEDHEYDDWYSQMGDYGDYENDWYSDYGDYGDYFENDVWDDGCSDFPGLDCWDIVSQVMESGGTCSLEVDGEKLCDYCPGTCGEECGCWGSWDDYGGMDDVHFGGREPGEAVGAVKQCMLEQGHSEMCFHTSWVQTAKLNYHSGYYYDFADEVKGYMRDTTNYECLEAQYWVLLHTRAAENCMDGFYQQLDTFTDEDWMGGKYEETQEEVLDDCLLPLAGAKGEVDMGQCGGKMEFAYRLESLLWAGPDDPARYVLGDGALEEASKNY